MNILPDVGLTFDDVLVVPQYTKIESRLHPNTMFALGLYHFLSPIISSHMNTVTETRMAAAMVRSGGTGIIHRFQSVTDQVLQLRTAIEQCRTDLPVVIGAAIGIKDDDLSRLEALVKAGVGFICIDVAHATNEKVIEFYHKIHTVPVPLMVGNIASGAELDVLFREGVVPEAIRIGIGSGSICTTRIVTGHGFPQLSAIDSVFIRKKWWIAEHGDAYKDVCLVADGGIRTSGDIVKALAVGADAVMLGSMLAGCDESPGDKIKMGDSYYKKIRGMSSQSILNKVKSNAWEYVAEGVRGYVPYRGPVSDLIGTLVAGIRSGLAYSGAENIPTLQEKAQFVRITQAGQIESNHHDIFLEK